MTAAPAQRDHGGGLDAAMRTHGGTRADWIDLSTGIAPVPWPLPELPAHVWTALPDTAAQTALTDAARTFWQVPDGAAVLAAPGASALIAQMPGVVGPGPVCIPGPTYNEHAAAFRAVGVTVVEGAAQIRVLVHPNNPDGRWYDAPAPGGIAIIDESFCDIAPERSHIALSARPGTVILKSFGKFWGLAGLRLGFAIGDPRIVADLAQALGPWPVSGPALHIGAAALRDARWAAASREQLIRDAGRLDGLMTARGARIVGGTPLFRLCDVDDAVRWQVRLAQGRVWSRVFPYSGTWLRLGLPAPDRWAQVEAAL